ncbi:stage II sporulation protein P [Paenibacillus sp. BSR1-1]|uniref:stage II sporulation protein P n=1 Tax=Paenibacillus sp. BSR1-1 TaxID=3020845 RepID=UPI0025AFBF3C|nr:stage II sporulation protein P [Paenibacillus sp. BSR1-1]MDN3015642.1 stage II sporulation protein P [Paenibacillus sp. BSR1-1]
MNPKIIFSLKLIYRSVLIVLVMFFMISLVVVLNINISSLKMSNSIGIVNGEKLFVQFFKLENHTFFPKLKSPAFTMSKMSNLAFQVATAIKPTDSRTLLGNEIPGLRVYDTEIVVGGEGTNLTNLPSESSPPNKVLLNERKAHEELLKESQSTDDNKPLPDPKNKTVFIYQTHSWESFLPLLNDAEKPDDAISSDERVNVIGLGNRLAKNLMSKGIGVEHDKTNMTQELLKKGWESTKAYTESREIVEAAAKNNQLKYLIDIHRDSLRKQITTKTINNKNYARINFVIGRENKNYLENLELAKVLNKELEKKYPGISRGVFLKTYKDGNGVYNQDISNHAMLLEIGGVDNNLSELHNTIDAFSEILADYYWKSNESKEVNGHG